MALAKLHGMILAAIRSIHFRPPRRGTKSRHHFLAGRRIGIEWWTTWKTALVTEKIACLAKRENPSLACADEGQLAEVFVDCLREAVSDTSLFDIHAILSQKPATLYDAIVANDKLAFAEAIYQRWVHLAMAKIAGWVVLVPLESVDCIAARIDASVQILPSRDTPEWHELRRRYLSLIDLDVGTGRLENLSCFSGGVPKKPFSWLAFEGRGFAHQLRGEAAEETRTLLSVAFAAASGSNPYLFAKTKWSPTDRCVQFADAPDRRWTHAGIGTVMPSISGTLTLSAGALNEITTWYAVLRNRGGQTQQRAVVAAQFLHQALLEDDVQQFISYFIVLDALFGKRGNVEQNIIAGVKRLDSNRSGQTRCGLLFDLRSALVHGEVSNIRTWRKLPIYRRLFHSEPWVDVQKLALKALYQYPFVK
jgi:hypothetical protein